MALPLSPMNMEKRSARHYLCQLADRTALYLSKEDGIKAMTAHSNGESLFVRGRYISNHFVSQIRPCSFEEEEEATIQTENEKRSLAFREGKLKIEEKKDKEGLKFELTGDKKVLNELYPDTVIAIESPKKKDSGFARASDILVKSIVSQDSKE